MEMFWSMGKAFSPQSPSLSLQPLLHTTATQNIAEIPSSSTITSLQAIVALATLTSWVGTAKATKGYSKGYFPNAVDLVL